MYDKDLIYNLDKILLNEGYYRNKKVKIISIFTEHRRFDVDLNLAKLIILEDNTCRKTMLKITDNYLNESYISLNSIIAYNIEYE